MNTEDSLHQLICEITKAAEEAGIDVIRGSVEENRAIPVAYLDDDYATDSSALIRHAKSIGARFAFLDICRLEEADIDEAKSTVEETVEAPERDKLISTLKECEDRIGQVALVELSFIVPGSLVLPQLQVRSSWHKAIYNTEAALGGDSADEGEWNRDAARFFN